MLPTPQNIVSITYQLNKIVGDPKSILAQMPILTVQYEENSILRTKAVSFQELRPYLDYLQQRAISQNKVIVCDPEKYYNNKVVFEIGEPSSSGVAGVPPPPTFTVIDNAIVGLNNYRFAMEFRYTNGDDIDVYSQSCVAVPYDNGLVVLPYLPPDKMNYILGNRTVDGLADQLNIKVSYFYKGVLVGEDAALDFNNWISNIPNTIFDTIILTPNADVLPNIINWDYLRSGGATDGSLVIKKNAVPQAQTTAGAIAQSGAFGVAAGNAIQIIAQSQGGAQAIMLKVTNVTDNIVLVDLTADTSVNPEIYNFNTVAGKKNFIEVKAV